MGVIRGSVVVAIGLTGAVAPAIGRAAPPASSGAIEVAPVEFIQITPLSGSGIDIDKVPSNVATVSSQQIQRRDNLNVEDALQQYVPGVSLSNPSGNPFQFNLDYRGFTASPLQGTPQGLAVYQDGVRINEAFGDVVNFDLIPTLAIRNIEVVSNNPVYGLNALGGAVSIQLKDGFTYQGFEANIQGGSFGRIQGGLQYGKQVGNYAAYLAIEGLAEDGFRDFSQSQILRGYGDVGYKGDRAEVHLSFTGAQTKLGNNGNAPIELIAQQYSDAYTTPQTSANSLAFVNLRGTAQATDTISIQSNIYFRHYDQAHVDGNPTNAQSCNIPGLLCYRDRVTPAIGPDGQQLPDLSNGRQLGEIDRTNYDTNSYGGTVQATDTERLFGHDNHLVFGSSYDHGVTRFRGTSEVATIDADFVVTGLGQFLNQPFGSFGARPTAVLATNDYLGFYATDTFDVTDRLSVTADARYNFARIALMDQGGGDANGINRFTRLNPGVGATYKITPEISAFGGYSEANRAPTPLELGCADPANPCLLENFLVSDPPLKQVVARSFQAGLRGHHDFAEDWGGINWSVAGFRTDDSNDILNIPSPIVQGFGFFQNVGNTRRQGVESQISYHNDRFMAYANFSFVDATFQSAITLSSNSPFADNNGLIQVVPGDRLPAIPRHNLKTGFDYLATPKWKIGADFSAFSGRYFRGDESNQDRQLPGFGVVNAHTSYQVTDHVQVFALVDNLFDRHYFTFGGYNNVCSLTVAPASNSACAGQSGNFPTNAHSVTPAAPFAVYGGIRVTF